MHHAVHTLSAPTLNANKPYDPGGLQPSVATSYLAALNALINESPAPSPFSRLPALTYSFGRALQQEAMEHYVNKDETKVKEAYAKWSKVCGLAAQGKKAE
jgi:fructose-bisphosphate aldolase, class I